MINQEIHDICDKYNITNYSINLDGSIDVDGNVYISGYRLSKLPLKFNRIRYNFYCGNNLLTDLENFPNEISGSVYLSGNNLKNLKGFGKVGGITYIHGNPLESLKGYDLPYEQLICNDKLKLIRKTKLKILDTL